MYMYSFFTKHITALKQFSRLLLLIAILDDDARKKSQILPGLIYNCGLLIPCLDLFEDLRLVLRTNHAYVSA